MSIPPLRRPNPIVHDADGWWLILDDKKGREKARARISRQDVPLVRTRRWSLHAHGYAVSLALLSEGRSNRTITLHRLLMDEPVGLQVDHINGDRLDDRRCNLRVGPRIVNAQNVAAHKGTATGHRNVNFQQGRYVVRAGSSPKTYGGSYATLDEALVAARALRAKLFPYVNEKRH